MKPKSHQSSSSIQQRGKIPTTTIITIICIISATILLYLNQGTLTQYSQPPTITNQQQTELIRQHESTIQTLTLQLKQLQQQIKQNQLKTSNQINHHQTIDKENTQTQQQKQQQLVSQQLTIGKKQ